MKFELKNYYYSHLLEGDCEHSKLKVFFKVISTSTNDVTLKPVVEIILNEFDDIISVTPCTTTISIKQDIKLISNIEITYINYNNKPHVILSTNDLDSFKEYHSFKQLAEYFK